MVYIYMYVYIDIYKYIYISDKEGRKRGVRDEKRGRSFVYMYERISLHLQQNDEKLEKAYVQILVVIGA